MQPLGRGLGQAVGKSLEHDEVVVVVLRLELGGLRLDPQPGGDGKQAEVIALAAVARGDEVSQAAVGFAGGLLALLAQEVEGGQYLVALAVLIEFHVVIARPVGREEPHHGAGGEPLLTDDALQHRLGVGEQLLRLFTLLGIVEDLGEAALQLPGVEEGGPVDVGGEHRKIDGVEGDHRPCLPGRHLHFGAAPCFAVEVGHEQRPFVFRHQNRGYRRGVLLPLQLLGVGPGRLQGERLGLVATGRMVGAHLVVVGLELRGEVLAGAVGGGDEVLGHPDGARGVLHPHHRLLVGGVDLHRGMGAGGGGTADEQGDGEALALHLLGHVDHLVQGGGDEARQPDDVHVAGLCLLQDFGRGDHHAEVDDLEVVALQHHPDDVLADVVHIALHRGEQDAPGGAGPLGLLRLDEGDEVGHGLFHHPGGFDHLGQEHLAVAEEVAHGVHAVHEGPFDHLDGALELLTGLFGVLLHVGVDALDERVGEPLCHREGAPLVLVGGHGRTLGAGVVGGDLEQPVGGVGAAVQHHVLHRLAQILGQFVIDRQLRGVDDTHVHAGMDGVVEEHRVDGLAHRVVAAEREGDVGDAAGNEGVRQVRLDPAGGLDEVHRVVVVLLDAGGDGEDVGIEDDVFGREAHLLGEDPVGALADRLLARQGVGLPLLVEGHDDGRGAVLAQLAGLRDEVRLAFLEGDGVHHPLALDALEPRLQDLPLGGVEHHRHLGDVRLGGDEVEEGDHGLDAVQHRLVHVHVDHLGAVLHLLAADVEGLLVLLLQHQALELGRAGDVGPLAHIHEQRVGADIERFQPGEAAFGADGPVGAGGDGGHGLGNGADVAGAGAAAAADDVEEARLGPLLQLRGHGLGGFVIAAEGVGQSRIGVGGDGALGDARELLEVLAKLLGPQGAVQAEADGAGVAQ